MSLIELALLVERKGSLEEDRMIGKKNPEETPFVEGHLGELVQAPRKDARRIRISESRLCARQPAAISRRLAALTEEA